MYTPDGSFRTILFSTTVKMLNLPNALPLTTLDAEANIVQSEPSSAVQHRLADQIKCSESVLCSDNKWCKMQWIVHQSHNGAPEIAPSFSMHTTFGLRMRRTEMKSEYRERKPWSRGKGAVQKERVQMRWVCSFMLGMYQNARFLSSDRTPSSVWNLAVFFKQA